ncbi:pyridoxamine 5'-phosphate oxidase [bacterium]|nr:MAG: pyridoxamine 5'-phosphate oxidase [bacterium]
MNLSDLRKDYAKAELSENDVDADPIVQFQTWFEQAAKAEVPEPNAMSIATVSASGKPSNRVVLLKGFDERGFVFYTNYNSRKGHEIENNPNVSLLFFWPELERQIRIEGIAEKISTADSMKYFFSRPVASQLGAWASAQSAIIEGRNILEKKMTELTDSFSGRDIPFPQFWGGFRVVPESIEFWQGRKSRLHDRIQYLKHGDVWRIQRLSP